MYNNFNSEELFPPKKRQVWPMVSMAIVILLLAGISVYLFLAQKKIVETDTSSSVYQAIFLSNGQVYFGNTKDINKQYIELTDVYYLQMKDALNAGQKDANSELALVKLGSELHGPQDKMHINRDHVLFVEDLKGDSKVMRAIREYKVQ
jgi:hypothetical protein